MQELRLLYDWLCQCNKKCVREVDYTVFKDVKNILVISVIEEARFKVFMDNLRKVNPEIRVIIVVQDYVFEAFQKQYASENILIKWHGKYTQELLDAVSQKIELQKLEGFVFFSDMAGNLRDCNFLKFAEKMPADVKVINWTIGDELFAYNNLKLYLKTIEVYNGMNELIELEEDLGE